MSQGKEREKKKKKSKSKKDVLLLNNKYMYKSNRQRSAGLGPILSNNNNINCKRAYTCNVHTIHT